jgi:membrane protease YdiL (CAAX protease family)
MDSFLILLQILIIGIYLYRFSLIDRFPKPYNEFFLQIATDMKTSMGIWWKTILIPILVIVVAYIIWVLYITMSFQHFPSIPVQDPLPIYIITNGVLAPVSEEILQCFFLSAMFILFINIYKSGWMIGGMCFATLTIVSYIFANAHTNPTSVNWLLRFFQFMIYGALYYLNDRNLVPAIVAHSTWNLILLSFVEI